MHPGYQAAEYRQQVVMGASQLRLVMMTHDLAINACEQRDFSRATRAVGVLRDALDFESEDSAVGLFRLYQRCLDCLRCEEYQAAKHILVELREAWISADKQLTRAPGSPAFQT